jgi:hypothetical protein
MTPTITSTPIPAPTIIPTEDRVVANDDVMEEEQGDGSADAIVGPGTGN